MRECWSVWLTVALAGLVDLVASVNTFEMPWSSQSFGPDGPWHAVKVKIGSSNAAVSLYPGNSWESHILTPPICSNASLGTICYAQAGGLYEPTLSKTSHYGRISTSATVDYSHKALQIYGREPGRGIDNWKITNTRTSVYPKRINMAFQRSSWATLPDGSTYPLTLGNLALGAPGHVKQKFTDKKTGKPYNTTLLPGFLSTEAAPENILSSNSYGLYIGSVSPRIAPSLYFGGYDRNLVVGTVSTQQGYPDRDGAIDLLDININVDTGESPWSFDRLDGLLASGNDSMKVQVPVGINSLAPYLHLPRSTCDAIASHLPVTFKPKYGLYFWNTDDPQYEKIVTSPSSIGFTFRVSESSENFTINVPFALLNLTLTGPLTTTPTQYFPCKVEEQTYYQLGRSFLQAAFLGVNWNAFNGSAAWWLAQAPGPTPPTQASIKAIGNEDTSISSSELDWASTWADTWKPLSKSDTQTGDSASPSSTVNTKSGLSTGAKAGIGAACGVVGLAIIIAAIMFFLRRNRKEPVPDAAEVHVTPDYKTYDDPPKPPEEEARDVQEMHSEQRHELHGS